MFGVPDEPVKTGRWRSLGKVFLVLVILAVVSVFIALLL
jgi:hypothetical protein